QFFPVLVSLTERVLSHWQQAAPSGLPLDADAATQRLTVDVIGRFAFDRDFGATGFGPNTALQVVGELMTALQRMMNPLNRWFPWRQEARSLRSARSRYDSLVRAALADLSQRPPAPHCLLAHLAGVTDPDTGKPLSPRRLRCETALFWIAGFETTAHAISWTLMYIAALPEVESRIASELA
ncbi:hypothetical protein Agub_g5357, partial [Astrephomene gubernaculifera]